MATPPARSPAHGSASSLADLPVDVISLVVAHFALRPRLLLIARVCRRWRAAAYRSVTLIPPPLCYLGPLDRYPNLTACRFVESAQVPESWTAEQRGRIRSVYFFLSSAEVLRAAKLTSLTSLSVYLDEDALQAVPETVLANANSLAHLKIAKRVGLWSSPPSFPQLTAPLPALSSLSLRYLDPDSLTCFPSVYSQLTRLKTLGNYDSCSRLPQLRSAAFDYFTFSEAAIAWVASLRSLTSLRMGGADCDSNWHPDAKALAIVAPVLASTSLCEGTDLTKALLAILPTCKRLSHVCLLRDSLSLLPSLLPLAAHITSMKLCSGDETAEEARYLAHLTSLTELDVLPGPLTAALPHWRLPRLRQLVTTDMPLAWLTTALRSLTTLQRLKLSKVHPSSLDDVQAFEAEVRAADRRGMRTITIWRCHSVDIRALQRSLGWLTLAVTEIVPGLRQTE